MLSLKHDFNKVDTADSAHRGSHIHTLIICIDISGNFGNESARLSFLVFLTLHTLDLLIHMYKSRMHESLTIKNVGHCIGSRLDFILQIREGES